MSRVGGVFGRNQPTGRRPTHRIGSYGCNDRVVKIGVFLAYPPPTRWVACPACGLPHRVSFLWREMKSGEAFDALLEDVVVDEEREKR